MRDIKSISEHNKLDDILDELDAAIPLAVKLQRENGNTNGALNALRDIVNKAIGINSPPASRASFSRAHIIEKAFDKARIVYQRANQPASAVASGVVSYFMAVKRLSASAELYAARADEQRSPKYQSYFHVDPQEAKQAAKMWEEDAKSELAKAHAALTDAAILAGVGSTFILYPFNDNFEFVENEPTEIERDCLGRTPKHKVFVNKKIYYIQDGIWYDFLTDKPLDDDSEVSLIYEIQQGQHKNERIVIKKGKNEHEYYVIGNTVYSSNGHGGFDELLDDAA